MALKLHIAAGTAIYPWSLRREITDLSGFISDGYIGAKTHLTLACQSNSVVWAVQLSCVQKETVAAESLRISRRNVHIGAHERWRTEWVFFQNGCLTGKGSTSFYSVRDVVETWFWCRALSSSCPWGKESLPFTKVAFVQERGKKVHAGFTLKRYWYSILGGFSGWPICCWTFVFKCFIPFYEARSLINIADVSACEIEYCPLQE